MKGGQALTPVTRSPATSLPDAEAAEDLAEQSSLVNSPVNLAECLLRLAQLLGGELAVATRELGAGAFGEIVRADQRVQMAAPAR
jgi:hypothetical protein